MHRRSALGDLRPPATAAFFEGPPLIAKYQVGGGWRMWIAGAGRGLGARLMVEVTLDLIRGYRPLRNEKPRMGVRGCLGGGGGWG
jgi:hypothetical protein